MKIPFEGEIEEDLDSKGLTGSMTQQQIKASAINALSIVPQTQANRLAYKDMNMGLYLLCTFGLYGLEMLLSCFISDISIVFEFASAFAVSALAFWFPAYYYQMAVAKYGQNKSLEASQMCQAKSLGWMGHFNCFIGLSAAAINVYEHLLH